MFGASPGSRARVRGWAGKMTGSPSRPRPSTIRASRSGCDVRLAVDRRDDVAARGDLEPLQDARTLARDRREAKADVGHHVADDLDPPGYALTLEGRGRPLVGRQQELRDPIDGDPVSLLGHREIAAPKARLDVRDRYVARSASAPASVEFVSP